MPATIPLNWSDRLTPESGTGQAMNGMEWRSKQIGPCHYI